MTVNPVQPNLEVTLNGNKESIFMSYALLNRLSVIVNGADGVSLLATDPSLQEQVLFEVSTKREGKTVVFRPEDLDDVQISIEDMDKLIDWVGGHIIDFFLKSTEKMVKNAEKYKGRLESLQHIASGLPGSVSTTPAASSLELTPPVSTQ